MVVSGAWRPPARWRRAGYDVVLFEKSAWLGGKAAELHVEGYRFDMGPTILLMPSVLKKIFAEAGRDLGDELEMVRARPAMAIVFCRRLDTRPAREHEADGGDTRPVRPGQGGRSRVTSDFSTSRGGSTTFRIATFSGVRSAGSRICLTRRQR